MNFNDKNCSLLVLHFFKHNLTRYLSTEWFCLSILNTPRDIPTLQTETRTEPARFSPGGVTQQSFCRGGSAPRSNPLPFYIPFLTGRNPFRMLSIDKWYPFYLKKNWMQGWQYGKELIYYRPIFRPTKLAFLSANGNPTERISEFVSCHLNPLVQLLPSYVKNTTHLVSVLNEINVLPTNGIFITLVRALLQFCFILHFKWRLATASLY